ncbi:hypothetical protein MBANPS3_005719 [Mucor bainieri]
MNSSSIGIDDLVSPIQSTVNDDSFAVTVDALVDQAVTETRECITKMHNPVAQTDVDIRDELVNEATSGATVPTTLIDVTKGMSNSAAAPKNTLSESNDTIYRCSFCLETTASYSYFQVHLQVVHNKDQDYDMVKHPQLAPNLDEFNTYCHPCEQECTSVMCYQQHLKWIHHVQPRDDHIKRLGTATDSIDLIYHCGTCKVHFKTSGEHQSHLQSQDHLNQLLAVESVNHCLPCNITYPTQEHPSDGDPNRLPRIVQPFNYCYDCNKQCRDNIKYVRHLKHKHKKILLQHKKLPKLSDLGCLCLICKLKFGTQTLLQDHFKNAHAVKHGKDKMREKNGSSDFAPTDPHAEIIPDINAHNYCRSCQTEFLSNWNYRIHLRLVHYLYVEGKTEDALDGTSLPDRYSSDWYCHVCKKQKKSSRSYRKHCKRVHHMKVKRREARQS